jgi:hypothetical protein
MTPLQQELFARLLCAVAETGSHQIVYRTEYLGYLPSGQYHRVTVGGKDVSLHLPEGCERRDLEALADAGALVRVSHWVNPQDECEMESEYYMAASDARPATAPAAGRNR